MGRYIKFLSPVDLFNISHSLVFAALSCFRETLILVISLREKDFSHWGSECEDWGGGGGIDFVDQSIYLLFRMLTERENAWCTFLTHKCYLNCLSWFESQQWQVLLLFRGRNLNLTPTSSLQEDDSLESGQGTPSNPLLAFSTETHRRLLL